MIDFAIHPPIHILGREGLFVRSTAQAAEFVREHMLRHPDGAAARLLCRLERVNSAAAAQHAAKAFRNWIVGSMVQNAADVPKGKAQSSGTLRAHSPRPH
jgi:hypothetical protein